MANDLKAVIQKLKKLPFYQNNIEKVIELPPRPAHYQKLKCQLSQPVMQYLRSKNIKKLYTHQVEAIEKLINKENIIITTSTASGKTLAFLLPILDELCKNKKATALLIYPLKALSNDQYKLIKEIDKISELNLNPGIYDGDTPQELKAKIRNQSRLILTNPYELHQSICYHYKWASFFKNLKYIVIDEAHSYRGVFGSNTALLFRRLKRILKHYNATVSYVLSSASIANPLQFARILIGENFKLISEDGSPEARRYLILWNSQKTECSSFLQTRDIFLTLISNGLQTLCFVKSRKAAEILASWVKEKTAKKVLAYRAGYLPSERREIENALKERKIDGVVATPALELGIDIGSLDAVIISGFPNSIASFWQQAGRTARKLQDSLIIFVALEDVLEQYLLRNPQPLLQREFEKLYLCPTNFQLLVSHVLCACSELPLKPEKERKIWQKDIKEELSELKRHNLVASSAHGYIYIGGGRPQAAISLDDIETDEFEIICNDKLIETITLRRAYREAHPSAVILRQAKTYLVEKFDLEAKKIWVKEKELDYYTESLKQEMVTIDLALEKKKCRNIKIYLGFLNIREKYIGYRVKKFDQVIGYHELDLPLITYRTQGIWFTIPTSILQSCQKQGFDPAGGLHGLEHLLIGLSPLIASCDRNDLGGLAEFMNLESGKATVFIYEGYRDGVGIAEILFQNFEELLIICSDTIKKCSCEMGCPSCIYSPKCGNNNKPMDKYAASFIIERINSTKP